MQEYVLLLATLGAALRGLPLPKQPDADALAISALAALWGLVCVFESFRAYRGTLIDAKVLFLLISGLAVTLGAPRTRFFVVGGYSVVLAVWVVLKVPYSWDSEYWQAQTDATVVASLCLLPASLVVPAVYERCGCRWPSSTSRRPSGKSTPPSSTRPRRDRSTSLR